MRNLVVLLLMFGAVHAQTVPSFTYAGVRTPYVAIVFLSPECPLCQRYTVSLNALAGEYASSVTILGVFAGRSDSDGAIRAFQAKYHVAFPLFRDPAMGLVRRLRATVTPEVFLLDARHAVLYRGAIDDKAVSLGVSRTQSLHSWLREAIGDVLAGRVVAVSHTEPVGCLMEVR